LRNSTGTVVREESGDGRLIKQIFYININKNSLGNYKELRVSIMEVRMGFVRRSSLEWMK